MAKGTNEPPGLSFSRETFAKLTPGPFLHAHLKQPNPVRPNGRSLDEFRKPTVNTGSLTHSNGSAVVRNGDTAVVCGVRAEVLLASDVPHPPKGDVPRESLVEDLGLLVPNVELSTGCSPSHLPGNPPGTLAQSLSYRVLSLLNMSNIIDPSELEIKYTEPQTDDDLPDEGPQIITKAYWTLYIDILCIALDGNAFDTIWAAVMAAFKDTILPKAWWDPDREMIICSPHVDEATQLKLNDLPISSTFMSFTTASPLKQTEEAENWVLADPDTFEEDVCNEALTVVTANGSHGRKRLLKIEKVGGAALTASLIRDCVQLAAARCLEWHAILDRG